MLGYHVALRASGPIMLQYWRSAKELQRFAREGPLEHLAAWRMFNHWVGFTGDVGFWPETYVVQAGAYEAVYGNMPRFGLAVAGEHMPVGRKGRVGGRPATPRGAPPRPASRLSRSSPMASGSAPFVNQPRSPRTRSPRPARRPRLA